VTLNLQYKMFDVVGGVDTESRSIHELHVAALEIVILGNLLKQSHIASVVVFTVGSSYNDSLACICVGAIEISRYAIHGADIGRKERSSRNKSLWKTTLCIVEEANGGFVGGAVGQCRRDNGCVRVTGKQWQTYRDLTVNNSNDAVLKSKLVGSWTHTGNVATLQVSGEKF